MARINVLEMLKEKNPYIEFVPEEDQTYMILTEKQVIEILQKGCVFVNYEENTEMGLFIVSSIQFSGNDIRHISFGCDDNGFLNCFIDNYENRYELYLGEI